MLRKDDQKMPQGYYSASLLRFCHTLTLYASRCSCCIGFAALKIRDYDDGARGKRYGHVVADGVSRRLRADDGEKKRSGALRAQDEAMR